MEVTSRRVLWEREADRALPMASTTKILTALIVAEDCDPDAAVTVPEEAAGVEGSSVYLCAGETLTVRDLLYGLLLRSGNDCAVALALHHSGSVEAFSACMNARAASLGAVHSHFCNPHGLPAAGHFTTAHDLALIASAALENALVGAAVSSPSYRAEGSGGARVWYNKNKMLAQYEGADGVKTGYTAEAGRCLVASARRGGMHLVSVVLNSPDMYARSSALLDAAFARFSMKQLFDAERFCKVLPTDVRGKSCALACRESFWYPLAEEEEGQVRTEEALPSRLALPVHRGDAVGELKIYLKNQLLFCQKIVSIEDKEKSYFDILRELTRSGRQKSKCGSTNTWPNAASPAAAPATG